MPSAFTMIDTIILDLDGPILDGRFRHYACYSNILTENGFAPLPLDDYWQMKREGVNRRRQLEASGAESLYDIFLDKWLELIESPEYLQLDRIQPGVIETLEQWKRLKIRMLLATQRHNPTGLDVQLKRLGLLTKFDRVLPSEHQHGGAGKARRVSLAFPSLSPNSCLWIGDTEADIEAGCHFGCLVYAVTCGLRTQEFLEQLKPDATFDSISEIQLPSNHVKVSD